MPPAATTASRAGAGSLMQRRRRGPRPVHRRPALCGFATHDSMSLNGTPFNIDTAAGGGMIQGISGKIILCKEFTLADTDAKDLADLNLLVHINIS